MSSFCLFHCPFRPPFLFKTFRQYSSKSPSNFVIERVKSSDFGIVSNFMQEEFRLSEPISKAIGCLPSDTEPIFNSIYAKCSPYDLSFLAKNDEGKMIGLLLNAPYKFDELHKRFGNVNFDPDKTEFGEEISNGPYATRNANRLIIFLEWLECTIVNTLPPETIGKKEGLVKLEVMSVIQEEGTARSGVGSVMLRCLIKVASGENYSHLFTCATARASQKGLRKFGFESYKRISFNAFLDNGEPIFAGVHDKGEHAELMILPL